MRTLPNLMCPSKKVHLRFVKGLTIPFSRPYLVTTFFTRHLFTRPTINSILIVKRNGGKLSVVTIWNITALLVVGVYEANFSSATFIVFVKHISRVGVGFHPV